MFRILILDSAAFVDCFPSEDDVILPFGVLEEIAFDVIAKAGFFRIIFYCERII